MKKRALTAIGLLTIGIATIIVGCQTVKAIPEIDLNNKKRVVYEMYTFQCERCGYSLAEGEFGYIDNTGWERCPECEMYREIALPRY